MNWSIYFYGFCEACVSMGTDVPIIVDSYLSEKYPPALKSFDITPLKIST